MTDKCYKCLFADNERDMNATIPVCNRERNFAKAMAARENKEPCPWHITLQELIEKQEKGLV